MLGLVLITNRTSHMGFRLAPKSVTLNDIESFGTTTETFHLPSPNFYKGEYAKIY